MRLNTGIGGTLVPINTGTTDVNSILQNAYTNVVYAPSAGDVLRFGANGGFLLADNAGGFTVGDVPNQGTLTAGGATNTAGNLILTNRHATNVLTVNSSIANNGTAAVAVTYGGRGAIVVNGSNTYTGGTSLGGSVVTLGSVGALGNAANALTLGGGVLNLNGFSPSVGALSGTGGVIRNDSATQAALTIGAGGGAGTFQGSILDAPALGAIRLIKTGTGTITLSGDNSYRGGTTIANGILGAASANALGTGPIAFEATGANCC
ncbi:MAG: autotransporter-associated beta strand repeat-containing protein [Pirellulales bacterium]